MIFLHRRLTFQLTPLLDLLLIVIFAQYLDVQRTAETVEAESSDAVDQLAALNTEQALLRSQLKDKQSVEEENDRLRDQLLKYENTTGAELARAREHRDLLSEMMREVLDLPDDLVEDAMETLSADTGRTPEDVERLRTEFQEMSRKRSQEIIAHVVFMAEVRKRVDLWNIHLDETGVATVDVSGRQKREFRFESVAEFDTKLYQYYRQLPTPKDVVIILLSFDYDTPYRLATLAMDGLPEAAEHMRRDSGSRTRFEYAILGSVKNE